MQRALNVAGNLFLWGGGIAWAFDLGLGIPWYASFSVLVLGGILLLVRFFMRERKGEEV